MSLTAFTLWSIADTLVKLSSDYGFTAFSSMIFLGFGSAFCLVIRKIFLKEQFSSLLPKSPIIVSFRALLSTIAVFCFYTAYMNLTLSEAYVVEFLAPFLISIGAAFFMHEKLSLKKLLIILLGFIGCVIAVAPELIIALTHEGKGNILIGYLAVFAGTFLFVSVQLISRKIIKTESPYPIIFIASTFIGVAGIIMSDVNLSQIKTEAFLYITFVPILNVIAAILMLKAHKIGEATTVSIFHYWQLVMGSIAGFIIWNSIPSNYLIIGSTIVVIAGIYMIYMDKKTLKLT